MVFTQEEATVLAKEDRAWFDEQLEAVLEELPQMVKDLIDRYPLS